jgi:hypothetical protein
MRDEASMLVLLRQNTVRAMSATEYTHEENKEGYGDSTALSEWVLQ